MGLMIFIMKIRKKIVKNKIRYFGKELYSIIIKNIPTDSFDKADFENFLSTNLI